MGQRDDESPCRPNRGKEEGAGQRSSRSTIRREIYQFGASSGRSANGYHNRNCPQHWSQDHRWTGKVRAGTIAATDARRAVDAQRESAAGVAATASSGGELSPSE